MSSSEEQVRILFEFLHHVSSLSAINSQTNEDGFAGEFHELKAISSELKNDNHCDTKMGSLPVNKKKNRYKDILPFEPRRVELHPIEGEEGSEYINASYIADPLNKLSYIAAQGPNTCTVDDFWRMLWYYAIEIVVMTCREVELGKSKCKCYWVSPGEVKQYGLITVAHISEENITEDFIQRKMHVRCGEEEQMLTQLHYTGWPDHGVPNDVLPILNVIKKFRAAVPYGNDVPIVIHCSAGCGRTGALIGIDYIWSLLEYKKFQTARQVYEIVRHMRLQRPAMVQAKDQYILVYKAVFQLVRQYLDEYQHDPSVAHMFDSTTVQKLSQISLPEYQNPSGLNEATNIEMEISEDYPISGHDTPMTTPKTSYDMDSSTPKTHPKPLKPMKPDKLGLPRKPVTINKPPETPLKPQELAREIEKQTFRSEAEKPVFRNETEIPVFRNETEKPTFRNETEKPAFRKSSPPSLVTKPLPVPKPYTKPKVDKGVHPPPKPMPHAYNGGNKPDISASLPLNSDPKPAVKLPLFPKMGNKLSEPFEENISKQIPMATPSLKEERKPIPVPTQAKVSIPLPAATNLPKKQATSSISELLKQASLDNGPEYSDDEDDYWDPKNNQPVSPIILQLNSAKNKAYSDDEDEYWEPKNNQPVSQSILKSSSTNRESISLMSAPCDSPPPLLPHRPFGGSQTNLSSSASIEASTNLANAPPIPLKSMEDRDLMRSTELLCPPPASFLVPNPVGSVEDDYDTIINVEKEISPLTPADIYNTPRNEPLISNGKPMATPPYQPKVRSGMGGIIASFKKTDLFKPKPINQTISHAPNIPISETVVTSDEQRRLNKRGKVEYGPVGFGIRVDVPNGPRPTPKTWKNYAPESL